MLYSPHKTNFPFEIRCYYVYRPSIKLKDGTMRYKHSPALPEGQTVLPGVASPALPVVELSARCAGRSHTPAVKMASLGKQLLIQPFPPHLARNKTVILFALFSQHMRGHYFFLLFSSFAAQFPGRFGKWLLCRSQQFGPC